MLGWVDVYKVVVATAPLYVALLLGYGSVKWWRMFKPDECDAINRFNCYFIIPFFTFHFTATVNPYAMNFRFLAGDVVAKAAAGGALGLWANLGGKFSWAITSFSLTSFNNTLVVGVPLLKAMFGADGEHLVIQSSVIQSLLWFPILLFLLEFWRASQRQADTMSASLRFRSTMKIVGVKLGKNPNCYACSLGLVWALFANRHARITNICTLSLSLSIYLFVYDMTCTDRWDIEMPSIVEGSILIMAKAGSGVAMFTMGLFMALQENIIACGVRLTIYSMVLRFVCGPLTTALGSLALGLRSHTLSIAIIQAALPQSITSFVFAQEYSLHANVLSTAVIFGTIVSLPLLIAYYAILDALH